MSVWASGESYEPFIGRWSRLIAVEFVRWLRVPAGLAWLDVGCGTGALTEAVVKEVDPARVVGIDGSDTYVAHARESTRDRRVTFGVGRAEAIPQETEVFDVAVSGLVLNFIHEPSRAAKEMARVVRAGGTVAAYVWDYADRMEMLRYFWNAASKLDRTARHLDEGRRFDLCSPARMEELLTGAGLLRVEVRAIDVPTVFRDFDDFWMPFLGGQGPAPGYVTSLDEDRREVLRERLRTALPIREDGSIRLNARAWAARGQRAS